jgi:Spy/CpxP family protein refolding chaperone
MQGWIAAIMLALAQDGRGRMNPERILGGSMEELKESLSLTEEQARQVQEIFDKARAGLEIIRSEGRMREMGEFRDAARAGLRRVLNEEQRKKYDAADERGRETSPGELKKRLDLTDEQTEKIGRLWDELREKTSKLSAGARESGDWAKFREEAERLRGETNGQIKNVLDDDQKKKFDEFLQEQPGRRSPRQRAEQLARELKIGDEAAGALIKVLELQAALRDQIEPLSRQVRQLVRDGGAEDEIVKKGEEIRAKRRELQKQLDEARAALRGQITKVQEAGLVAEGVLE